MLILAMFIGTLSGTHAAIWGMYKDAIHEGFEWPRFLRSVLVGAACGAGLQMALRLPLPAPSAAFVLFGLSYGTERAIVEVWKTFFRDEDQSKYFIPMQFSIRGEPVRNWRVRTVAGVAYTVLMLSGLLAISVLETDNRHLTTAFVGLATGLVVAIGGGWKDAPKEGFDLLKFFRSPIMTVLYALALSTFASNFAVIAIGAVGLERATAETYKTFFFPSKPRGKFSGKPIVHPEMLRRRLRFVPAYVAISVSVVGCFVAGVVQ